MPTDKEIQDAIADALADAAIETLKTEGPAAADPGLLEQIAGMDTGNKMRGGAFVDEASKLDDQLITVYSTYDGTPSTILVSMLSKQLRKKFNSNHVEVPQHMIGARAFSVTQTIFPEREYLKCIFHEESLIRQEIDEAGYKGFYCVKDDMRTKQDVALHAEHRHRIETKAVMYAREQGEKAERLEFERALLLAVTKADLTPKKSETKKAE